MDAQQMHDDQMAKRGKPDQGSKARLEDLLKSKNVSSSLGKPLKESDPYGAMLENHPGLTSQKLDQMLDAFGA